MCGLFGVVGDNVNSPDFEKIFNNGLMADTVRGVHSTGAACVGPDSFNFYKDAVTGGELVTGYEYEQWLLSQVKGKALLGHNRAATMGSLGVAGAHPFHEGNIILAHNGTLKNWWSLPYSKEYDVDSQVITRLISEKGIKETVSQLEGAWALTYADISEGTVNFCRNKERPLFFARLRNKWGKKEAINTWVYGSEKGMMKWIIERNGYEAVNFFQLKPEKLLTFDMNSAMSSFTITDLDYAAYNKPSYKVTYHGKSSTKTTTTKGKVVPIKKSPAVRKIAGVLPCDKPVVMIPTEFTKGVSKGGETHGSVSGYMVDPPYWPARIPYLKASCLGDMDVTPNPNIFVPVECEIKSLPVGHTNAGNTDSGTLIMASSGAKFYLGNACSTSFIPGPEDILISDNEWLCLTSDGCSLCGQVLTLQNHHKVKWDEFEPLCEDCNNYLNTQTGVI